MTGHTYEGGGGCVVIGSDPVVQHLHQHAHVSLSRPSPHPEPMPIAVLRASTSPGLDLRVQSNPRTSCSSGLCFLHFPIQGMWGDGGWGARQGAWSLRQSGTSPEHFGESPGTPVAVGCKSRTWGCHAKGAVLKNTPTEYGLARKFFPDDDVRFRQPVKGRACSYGSDCIELHSPRALLISNARGVGPMLAEADFFCP